MSNLEVETILPGTLGEADVHAAIKLQSLGFDMPLDSLDRQTNQFRKVWVEGIETQETNLPTRSSRMFVIREGDHWLAKAATFGRTIATTRGPMEVMGLAHVASDPNVRGQGLGRRVMLGAFKRVDRGEFAVAYFQTGPARGFYEKLGCRVVDNPLTGEEHPHFPGSNPLWEPHTMIYPANFDWPKGPIDLQGPAW